MESCQGACHCGRGMETEEKEWEFCRTLEGSRRIRESVPCGIDWTVVTTATAVEEGGTAMESFGEAARATTAVDCCCSFFCKRRNSSTIRAVRFEVFDFSQGMSGW